VCSRNNFIRENTKIVQDYFAGGRIQESGVKGGIQEAELKML